MIFVSSLLPTWTSVKFSITEECTAKSWNQSLPFQVSELTHSFEEISKRLLCPWIFTPIKHCFLEGWARLLDVRMYLFLFLKFFACNKEYDDFSLMNNWSSGESQKTLHWFASRSKTQLFKPWLGFPLDYLGERKHNTPRGEILSWFSPFVLIQ